MPVNEYPVATANAAITWRDRWIHILARCGVNRSGHRVQPGLHAVGAVTAGSPIFVTANYRLSFDALRSALSEIDGYILVLDTKGINVWCAAGKGTFGTDELVNRIEQAKLAEIVRNRTLILPQLGAPGIAAHDVTKRTGFHVEYGPIRAEDLPRYIASGNATPEMRKVRFDLRDRLVLIPVELLPLLFALLAIAAIIFATVRSLPMVIYEAGAALLVSTVLFPALLPWIPTRDFSTKGFILGLAAALPFAILASAGEGPNGSLGIKIGQALSRLLIWPPVIAFKALNFTGSTPFTSRTGVRKEIFRYIRIMGVMFLAGVILAVTLLFL